MSKSYVQRYEDNGQVMSTSDTGRWVTYRQYDELREQNRVLREALEGYAYCSDGCTCGDGWSHDAANEALTATSQEGQG